MRQQSSRCRARSNGMRSPSTKSKSSTLTSAAWGHAARRKLRSSLSASCSLTVTVASHRCHTRQQTVQPVPVNRSTRTTIPFGPVRKPGQTATDDALHDTELEHSVPLSAIPSHGSSERTFHVVEHAFPKRHRYAIADSIRHPDRLPAVSEVSRLPAKSQCSGLPSVPLRAEHTTAATRCVTNRSLPRVSLIRKVSASPQTPASARPDLGTRTGHESRFRRPGCAARQCLRSRLPIDHPA